MEYSKMISKTKILTSLAAIAVVGSAGVPFVASAQQSGGTAAPATAPAHGGRHGETLAAALGVTPEALAQAMEAARAAAPKPTPGQRPDEATRTANRTAFEAALAQNLGITVEKLQTAQRSVAPGGGKHKGLTGPGGPGHSPGGIRGAGNAALARALGIDVAKLTAAEQAVREALPKPPFTPGTRPDQATMEALKAQRDEALAKQLGISVDALKAAQEEVRAEFESQHAVQAQEMFARQLAQAVTNGKITQTKADELKAQFAEGGDAAKAAMKALHEATGALEHPHRGPGGRPGRGPSA